MSYLGCIWDKALTNGEKKAIIHTFAKHGDIAITMQGEMWVCWCSFDLPKDTVYTISWRDMYPFKEEEQAREEGKDFTWEFLQLEDLEKKREWVRQWMDAHPQYFEGLPQKWEKRSAAMLTWRTCRKKRW